ncbi:MAG: ornithine carbamoyltransferase [Nitrospirae bacterium]|nr:ornithine carbamoyltransferase [Candidatus Manganitrophaceae bacterium]
MPKRDLLSLASLPIDEIEWLLSRAQFYKNRSRASRESHPLAGRSIGLLFEKSSTRTRVSFEVAVSRLGGHPIFLSFDDIQIKRGETIGDTARVLSGYLDGLVIRTYEQEKLEEWAQNAAIPIINGLTDQHHPCQILSDLLTILEKRGKLKGLTLAYIGDGNNIAHSLMEGGAKVGMRVVIACPKKFTPDPVIIRRAQAIARETGGRVEVIHDPIAAAKGADIFYTDVWVSMGQEKEQRARRKIFKPYQINQKLIAQAKTDLLVMHCLPAHRGEEIAAEVMDGPHSIVFDQADNRLPMQQAILERWIG